MSSLLDDSSSDDEDCECISCLALFTPREDDGYDDTLRQLIRTGRNKDPFPDWDMVSGFFSDWINPFFRGFNLYSCYRLMTNNLNRHQWMTSCPGFSNFSCLPCTLFARGEKGTNFLVGEIDLPNITALAEKHSKNALHLKHVQTWLSYEQPVGFRYLDEKEKARIFSRDEIVRRRRGLVCFMITATNLLATQGLWFRKRPVLKSLLDSGDEPEPGPLTQGMFYETVQLLKEHTENDEITSLLDFGCHEWLTSDVQTKLIYAVAETIRQKIKSDLDKAEFASIIIEKPISIQNIDGPRTSTLVRYVDDKGGVHEACLGLHVVDQDCCSLFSHLSQICESYSLKDKLVAVACDGGSLITTQLRDFQKKLAEAYPRAVFVHCYGHHVDCTINQSLGNEIDSASSTFRLISMIDDLYRGNGDRQTDIRKFISQRSRIQQPLDFDRKLIHTLNYYRNQFIDYFIALPNDTELYNAERENGILDVVCKFIKEVKSAFCSKLFSRILVILEPLNDAISSKSLNLTYCNEQLEKVLESLKELRDKGFDALLTFVNAARGHLNAASEDGGASSEDMKLFYQKLFNDIIDNVINHLTVRFQYFTSLDFLSLLDPMKFSGYSKDFPTDSLKSLNDHFSLFQPQLEEELKTLYNTKWHKENITEFLRNFHNLQSGQPQLPEVGKLVNLIRTLPLSPISTEMTKYKMVENYIRLSKGIDLKESLSDLSVMYLEKSYIGLLDSKTIESRMTIDKIIDLFAEKIDRVEYYSYTNPN